MKLNSENIADLLAAANLESSAAAEEMKDKNITPGKLKPFAALFKVSLSSFIKNENRSSLTDRLTYSAAESYSVFLKYLKFLKLKNII